ncbi:hypothetical protein D3C76_1568660 [compost metagenome]
MQVHIWRQGLIDFHNNFIFVQYQNSERDRINNILMSNSHNIQSLIAVNGNNKKDNRHQNAK